MSRRCVSWLTVLLLSLLASPALSRDDEEKAKAPPLTVDKNVPGPFHPYNVTGVNVFEEEKGGEKKLRYNSKGRYHCLVTHFDQDPVVMLIARGLDSGDAFENFLRKLDETVGKNERVRLRAFVVFRYGDLDSLDSRRPAADVKKNDAKRDQRARTLSMLSEKLMLKNVPFGIAGEADLEKYKLDDTAALTAVLYQRYKIAALHVLQPDQINEEKLRLILVDAASKLGATR
jgi:hypothetical protein